MLHRFTETIWRAATDVRSYTTDFVQRRTSEGLSYLYWLSTTLALFTILPVVISIFVIAPTLEGAADAKLDATLQWYPQSLVLTVTGGTLKTNVKEPYTLELPSELKPKGDHAPTHGIVIDTHATVADIDRYDAAILLTSSSAVLRSDTGYRIFSYTELGDDIVVNHAAVDNAITTIRPFTAWLPWLAGVGGVLLLVAAPFIIGGISWLFHLLFLLWATLVVLIAARLMGRNLPYKALYRLGFFSITSSLILGFALNMLALPLWWPAAILYFVWTIVVVAAFPKGARMAPPAPAKDIKKTAPRRKKSLRPDK